MFDTNSTNTVLDLSPLHEDTFFPASRPLLPQISKSRNVSKDYVKFT